MANDASNHPQNSSDADMNTAGDHAEFDAVQLAQANTQQPEQPQKTAAIPAVPNGTVHVEVPAGEKVVRVAVANGETVILPPPFDDAANLAAKQGDGNLAIKVGDVTVILEGYQQTLDNSANPVLVKDEQGDTIDLAIVLANTDPNLEIETAAGPAAGAQGADNTGALLSAFDGAAGLGGLNAVGVLDATALQYKLIDNAIRLDRDDELSEGPGLLTITSIGPKDALNQQFLRDPVVTINQFSNFTFAEFIGPNAIQGGFDNKWADYDGTKAGQDDMHETGEIIVDPHNNSTVNVSLNLNGLDAQNLASNGVPLHYVLSADGTTIFGFRGDGNGTGAADGALVLVVHVQDNGTKNEDGTTHFVVDYYLVNRIDDVTGTGDGTHLDVDFNVSTTSEQTGSGSTGVDYTDDAPIATNDVANVANNSSITVPAGDTTGNDGVEVNDLFGADGKIGGTGGVVGVHAGSDGKDSTGGVGTDIKGDFGTLHLNADGSYTYTRFDDSPTLDKDGKVISQVDKFTYSIKDDDGDIDSAVLTINIKDNPVIVIPPPPPGGGDNPIDLNKSGTAVFESGLPARGTEPAGSNAAADTETTKGTVKVTAVDEVATVTVDGKTITLDGTPTVITGKHGDITVTWDKANNEIDYTYTLKDNDPTHSKAGNDVNPGEDFKVVVTDKDGDKGSGDIEIVIVDDVPQAKNDVDTIATGGTTATGNVITGDSTVGGVGGSGTDVKGADGATVSKVVGFGGSTDSDASNDLTVDGQYGKLTLKADGSYTYTRDPGSPGGVSDVFTYTLKDGDGDTSEATLTINVGDAKPEIHAPDADGMTLVYEKGLPEGSGELADGNGANNSDTSEIVKGTITYLEGDAPAAITITGKDGKEVAVTVGATIVGEDGTLVINSVGGGNIGYTYTLTDNDLDHSKQGNDVIPGDSFKLSITDKDGDNNTDNLVIKVVDDVPDAKNDTDSVDNKTNTATGNVVTGTDTTSGAAGADLKGADGAVVAQVVGQSTDADPAGGFTVQGKFGTLQMAADGTYTYTRFDGKPIDETDTFTYTLKDGDGDTDTATLTVKIKDNDITITDLTPKASGGDTKVEEDGLSAARGPGESAGSDGSGPVTGNGDFKISSPDGVQTLTIGGHDVVTNGVFTATSFTTDKGNTLNVTGYDAATGTVTYNYVLLDNEQHDPVAGKNSLFEDFNVTVTDKDGDQASDTLSVNIVDDVPTAKNDTDSVGNTLTTDGNVITGTGTTSGAGGADVKGADGATVSQLVGSKTSDSDASNTLEVQGTHGKLVMNADGTYTYTRDNGDPLKATDTFTYTLKDGDGDTSTATLVIDINDSKIEIKDLTPKADGGDTKVDEDGLLAARGAGESAGSDGSGPTKGDGDFTISAPDGVNNLSVDGHAVITNGVFAATSFTTALGNTLNVIGYDAATGKLTYNYVLVDNENHPSANGENSLFEDFAVIVTDKDGDAASGTLSVNIIDDVPTAKNDTDTVDNATNTATGNVVTGVGTTAGAANADVKGADNATVSGLVGSKGTDTDASNGLEVQGTFGKLVMAADGTYTYTRDAGTPGGASDTFTYTLTDKDGDTSTATLTVGIDDKLPDIDAPTAAGQTTVYEKGLPQGTGEMADGNSGNNSDKSEVVSGTITYTDGDAPAAITITGKDGKEVAVTVGATIVGEDGTLVINSVGGGNIGYTYTLTTNTSGDATTDSFKLSITDKDGDNATDNLVIKIVDDAPIAKADTDSVGNTKSTDGNVITGVGTTSGNSGIDLKGADGAVVSQATGFNGSKDDNAAGGFTVQGQYGKLVLMPDGSYTYTRDGDGPLTATDNFTYTLKDGDGDTSTTTLQVTIKDDGCEIKDLTPSANGGDTLVDEDGLLASRGAGESAGSDGSGPTKGNGDFTITAPDGVNSLSLDGHAVITNGVFSQTSWTTPFGNTMSITGYDSATGKISYNYTLNDNETHESGKGENSLFENLKVDLTDKDGDAATATLSVNIVDDVAVAVDGAKLLTGTDAKTNVLLIMDVSGSMADNSGVDNPNAPGNYTRLQLEGQTIINLLNSYAAAGQTMVQIATFSSDANVPNLAGGWMTVTDAINLVNQIVANGPQQATDYHDALAAGQQAFLTDGKIPGADNVAYFFSDGRPNEPTEATGPLTTAETQAWENFLDANDIKTYSIGLGSDVVQSQLDPIAYNGETDTDMNAFVVTNLNDLAAVINSTLPVPQAGDIVSSLGGTFGADGGHVASIVINGVTYTFAQAVAANAAHELTITTAGGKFLIDMDNGKYTYTPDFTKDQNNLDVGFTLIDNDGDTASGNLKLLAALPQFAVAAEPTLTTSHDAFGTGNYSAPAGTNSPDHIRDWTSGGSAADVHHSTINGLNGNDWIEAGAGNDTVNGGTGLDKILGGSGNDDLRGDSGNDWIDGGTGNDHLQGGADTDTMIGGAGSDKMDGGAGTDYFLKVDGADLDGTNTLDGTHTIDGGAGDDYVDLSGIAIFGTAQAARIENVEALSFTGGAGTAVTLDYNSVLNMTDANNNLVIHGDQGSDSVALSGGFTKIGADVAANDGQHYDVFQAGAGANQVTVFVDHALNATAN